MPEETTIATLAPESVPGPTPDSQVPAPDPQGPAPVQPDAPAKVEAAVQPTPSTEGARPRPSDFFRQRKERREIESLNQKFESLVGMIQRLQSPAPDATRKPEERNLEKDFYDKPIHTVRELIQMEREKTIAEFEQRQSQKEFLSRKQEALDLILKHEDIKKGGEEAMYQVQDILKNRGYDEIGKTNPILAVKNAIEYWELKYGRPKVAPAVPTAVPPKKSQMVSTQTGSPAAPKEKSMDDYKAELAELKKKILADNSLANDDAVKARISEIRKKLVENINKS